MVSLKEYSQAYKLVHQMASTMVALMESILAGSRGMSMADH